MVINDLGNAVMNLLQPRFDARLCLAANHSGFDQAKLAIADFANDFDHSVAGRVEPRVDAQDEFSAQELRSQLVPSFLSSNATPSSDKRSRIASPVA